MQAAWHYDLNYQAAWHLSDYAKRLGKINFICQGAWHNKNRIKQLGGIEVRVQAAGQQFQGAKLLAGVDARAKQLGISGPSRPVFIPPARVAGVSMTTVVIRTERPNGRRVLGGNEQRRR